MAISKFFANQLDLTNTQYPRDRIIIDSGGAGVVIGDDSGWGMPYSDKMIIERAAGVYINANFSNYNIIQLGKLTNGGGLISLYGSSAANINLQSGNINIITSGAGLVLNTPAGGTSWDISGGAGINIFDDGSGNGGFNVQLNNGVIRLKSTHNPIYLEQYGDNVIWLNAGGAGAQIVLASQSGIYITNYTEDPIYIEQQAPNAELKIENSSSGSLKLLQSGSGNIEILSGGGANIDLQSGNIKITTSGPGLELNIPAGGTSWNIGGGGGINIFDDGIGNGGFNVQLNNGIIRLKSAYSPIYLEQYGDSEIVLNAAGAGSQIDLISQSGIFITNQTEDAIAIEQHAPNTVIWLNTFGAGSEISLSAAGVGSQILLGSQSGIYITNNTEDPIYIRQHAPNAEIKLDADGVGSQINLTSQSGIFITNQTEDPISIVQSAPNAELLLTTAGAGSPITLNAAGAGSQINLNSQSGIYMINYTENPIYIKQQATNAELKIENSSSESLKLLQSGSGNIEILSSNGGNIIIRNEYTDGELIIKSGDNKSIISQSDIEFENATNGVILKARSGTKKFRLYIADDSGILTVEEVV